MESPSARNINVLMYIVEISLGIVLMIWTLWITVTAFIGGQVAFFFIDFTSFNLIRGLCWLIMLPLGAAAAGIGALFNSSKK